MLLKVHKIYVKQLYVSIKYCDGLLNWLPIMFVYSGLTSLSRISTVSGCDRELNAHFYSATSLKYHVPDTWHDTTPSHIILTLGRPVLALPRKSECQARSS